MGVFGSSATGMSRRKQRFPSHITGDGADCQDAHSPSSVQCQGDADEVLSVGGDTSGSQVPDEEASADMDSPPQMPPISALPEEEAGALPPEDVGALPPDEARAVTPDEARAVTPEEAGEETGDEGGASDVEQTHSDEGTMSECRVAGSECHSNCALNDEAHKDCSVSCEDATQSAFTPRAGATESVIIPRADATESPISPRAGAWTPIPKEEFEAYSHKVSEHNFACPVCEERFKSKRSFNSHILVHCQLVKNVSGKRSSDEAPGSTPEKRRASDHSTSFQVSHHCHSLEVNGNCGPLDLSMKKELVVGGHQLKLSQKFFNPIVAQCHVTVPSPTKWSKNSSFLSDRSSLEDENENLMNEAREHEEAFFDLTQNEHFLTEDSTLFDPPPPLPMFQSGGVIKKVRVSSDEGSPMVYRIKIHSEQVFVSRILGTNEETGDKIELYKCFMCNLSFPSVSRLQAHLVCHKQRFICSKCKYSCDSRVQFSHHVQKKHLFNDSSGIFESHHMNGDSLEDSGNPENTVTVAALLSALHGGSLSKRTLRQDEVSVDGDPSSHEGSQRNGEENPSPESPAESQKELSSRLSNGGSGDLFKMFSCRFCGKKFDRAFSCNRHERVHTGYKPCFCRICGRGFSEPRNLRHHVIRFHSDGSLRHLIKRDRRKRRDEEMGGAPSPPQLELVRGPCESDLHLSGRFLNSEDDFSESSFANYSNGQQNLDSGYTSNLTEIFSASLDNCSGSKIATFHYPSESLSSSILGLSVDTADHLEPGEIRLNLRTKIIEDEERGRRLVIEDDRSDEDFDHSPQFSAYAPRLDIVQEPVKRDKALKPITDDIGRTFYECPYCLKFFGSASDLNRHLDFHEDLRPYECKYCEYSARTNSQLKVHKMRHEGIKQFSCDVCSYNGVTQSDLNRHKKTQSHVARNQNVCSICGLGFYSSSQKQVHIVKCHPEMEGASSLLQMSLGIPPSSSLETPHRGDPTLCPTEVTANSVPQSRGVTPRESETKIVNESYGNRGIPGVLTSGTC